jgi:hypothetical protein
MNRIVSSLAAVFLTLGFVSQGVLFAAASDNHASSYGSVVGKLDPKYNSCLENWEPQFQNYLHMRNQQLEREALNAWVVCLGPKMLEVCRQQVTNLDNAIDQVLYMYNFKKYWSDFHSCGKNALMIYPPCKKVHPELSKKGSFTGAGTIASKLTYHQASWKSSLLPQITYYLNGAKFENDSNSNLILLDSWAGKTVSVVESLPATQCSYAATTKTISNAIKKITLKTKAASISAPELRLEPNLTNCYRINWPAWVSDPKLLSNQAVATWAGGTYDFGDSDSFCLTDAPGLVSGDQIAITFTSKFEGYKTLVQSQTLLVPNATVNVDLSLDYFVGYKPSSCATKFTNLRVTASWTALGQPHSEVQDIASSQFKISNGVCDVSFTFDAGSAEVAQTIYFQLEFTGAGTLYCNGANSAPPFVKGTCNSSLQIYTRSVDRPKNEWRARSSWYLTI